jgi:hypothetical protein
MCWLMRCLALNSVISSCLDPAQSAGPSDRRSLERTEVLALTVVPGGEYSYFVVFDLIDEAMLLVEAPGPVSGETMFEPFRLATSFE